MLDEKLETFVKDNKIESEQIYKSCKRVQQIDPDCLMCIDWLIASVEYEEFVCMMLDFKEG